MIHPFVWLFLNTAIILLIDFKSDIYLDSLSANRAISFIPRTCNLCHCIAQLEHRKKTNQLTREKMFFQINCNKRADNMSKRKPTDYFKPGNNKNVRKGVDSTVQNEPITETTT